MIKEAIEYLHGLAKPTVDVKLPEAAVPVVAVRNGEGGYDLMSLERFQTGPAQVKAHPKLSTAQSFVDYVDNFELDETVIFVGRDSFVAVIDYHRDSETPSWVEHRATYMPRHSIQWEAWAGNADERMNQVKFATFIERHLPDIVEPDSSYVLTSCLNFEAMQGMETISAHNLDTGEVNFKFVRENKQEEASFPNRFVLDIPIYENHDLVTIPCRLRYRVNDGLLTLWYEFVQERNDLVRKHFDTIADQIKSDLSSREFFYGAEK